MKKGILLVLVLVLIGSLTYSQQTSLNGSNTPTFKTNNALLFSEDFTGFTVGNLAGQNGWTKFGSGPDVGVGNTSPLTFPGYNSGGAEYMSFTTNSATSSRVYHDFTDTTYTLINPGTVIYYSLLLNLSTTFTTATNYFFSLGQAPGTSNYYAKLFALQLTPTTYNLGVSKSSNTANFATKVMNTGQTYLVIVRYNSNNTATGQSGNTCYMWINPVGSGEPDTALADAKVWAGQADYTTSHCSAIIWHNRGVNNPLGSIDGIKVAGSLTSSASAWTSLNPGPLPVELTSFTATTDGNGIVLNWSTATEINNKGFEIERLTGEQFSTIGFIAGHGTSAQANSYTFTDNNATNGTNVYRLKQVDFNGTSTYTQTVSASFNGATSFALLQNYPNPFNPETVIGYEIGSMNVGLVTLKVYDVLGKEIATLVNGIQAAGKYSVTFNASDLPSGMYLYKLQAGEFSATKKLSLMK